MVTSFTALRTLLRTKYNVRAKKLIYDNQIVLAVQSKELLIAVDEADRKMYRVVQEGPRTIFRLSIDTSNSIKPIAFSLNSIYSSLNRLDIKIIDVRKVSFGTLPANLSGVQYPPDTYNYLELTLIIPLSLLSSIDELFANHCYIQSKNDPTKWRLYVIQTTRHRSPKIQMLEAQLFKAEQKWKALKAAVLFDYPDMQKIVEGIEENYG